MSDLQRRLKRLEGGPPTPPSPYDAMDPILAEMTMPELISLANYGKPGRRPTAEDEATWRRFWDRLAFAGFVLS